VLNDFRDAARGAMAFGLHVHIGITRSSLRIEVMNRLRDVLPMILAISANAPFYEGRDTGLQSWRHSLLGRMPRMGLPEVWATEDAYWSHVNRLRGIGLIGMNAGLWEDLRLHHIYGTLEVRIMDSVFSLDRLWLIVALLQAEATTIEAELLANRAGLPTPRMLLEENKWAARRYGMKASFIDWNSDRRVEFREAFQMWLSRLAPAARHLGFALRLELAARTALHEGTLADKQRQWFSQAGSMAELVDQLVAETTRPLSKMLVDPEV
jgi:carboxylate-amine ligase